MKGKNVLRALTASLAILISSISFGFPAQAQSWLCIAEVAAGLAYDKTTNEWVSTRFNVRNIDNTSERGL